MYIQVTKTIFQDYFHRMGRGEQFSYEALNYLYDYIEMVEEEINPIELDVIALCCDYAEVTQEEFENDYDGDEYLIIARVDENNTILIRQG